jgi:hypothetical protein
MHFPSDEGEITMLKLNLRQTLITIILIAAMLAALAIGMLKIEAARSAPASPRSTHSLTWFCPPPPIPC